MAIQSHTALTAEQRTFYETLLLDRALPQLQHGKWGVKRTIPANSGTNIQFRRFELIDGTPSSMTALTEGTAGAEATPSISQVTATISQYGRYLTATDLLEDAAIDQVMTEYTEMLGSPRVCRA